MAEKNPWEASAGDSPTLADVQATVDEWIRTVGVRYFSELTNLAILTEEVGELARIMARRYGARSWSTLDERRRCQES